MYWSTCAAMAESRFLRWRGADRTICVSFAWHGRGVEAPVEIRDLARGELSRVGEIDRTERVDVLFEQHGTELVARRRGSWSASAWDPDGHGEHSVHAQRQALVHYADAGGIARGAFAGGRLVGIGVVVPHSARRSRSSRFST